MLTAFLNGVIRFALSNRAVVIAIATFALLFGGWKCTQLAIDVLPDLNRPRVVVMTEAPGLAPEEIETLVTFPLEAALNGATGVQAVRSSSAVGVSIIYVEFDWGTDIYTDRQIVTERIALAREQLPDGVQPQLAPISSIIGQVVVAGMYSQPNDATMLFRCNESPGILQTHLERGFLPQVLREGFERHGLHLPKSVVVKEEQPGVRWTVDGVEAHQQFTILRSQTVAGKPVEVHEATSPMQIRTLADWVVRQQLMTIPGVSQVFVMGGERRQFQVLVNPDLLRKYGVTLHDVELALERSNQNATGGYLDDQGANEFLVRVLGRVSDVRDLQDIVVKTERGKSILLRQVARVVEGAQVKRGDGGAYRRISAVRQEIPAAADTPEGGPAVILTINKQPEVDTRLVTDRIHGIFRQLAGRLPPDVRIVPELYQQSSFIDLAIQNVVEALRDGGILVVLILFLFLANFRTTLITLTAIPLSIAMTAIVFDWFSLSINTMTLGGLAIAIGELVDDAIVDVENIYRRLRENRCRARPLPSLVVVFRASVEIRNSIVFGTMIVVLVFIPLFALTGIEGRLFAPLGIAYIVSILSSLVVSLTVTPVLSSWLLVGQKSREGGTAERNEARPSSADLPVLTRWLRGFAGGVVRTSLRVPIPIFVLGGTLVGVAVFGVWRLERDFLPPFNEGAVQINVLLPPGISLRQSNEIAKIVDRRLMAIDDVVALVRKTGRAELDEHAEGVNTSEYIATLDVHSLRDREEVVNDIREELAEIPGIVTSVEQPISHLISHMLSGVKAQVAVKLFGDDLEVLRREAARLRDAMAGVDGVKDLQLEPQITIPQLRIEVDRHQLKQFGLTSADVTEFIQTAMQGRVVSEVLDGQRKYDLLVRLDEPFREDLESLKRQTIHLPGGGTTKLSSVANVYLGGGPNTINREQVRRRVVLQCNVAGRGLVDVVEQIQREFRPIEASLPEGYFVTYGGQFESQRTAFRMIALLFGISLVGVFLTLYSMFRSANLACQVMLALPMAFMGSVAALYVTGQTLTIAAMIGFISLCGIAARNGILLINHYLHLIEFEGETWSREMIVRAGQERLAPVLMTALTTGIGLVPLALAAGEPGKEILYPVATVMIGGLISSTLLEFLVRPALFWTCGLHAAQRVIERKRQSVELVEEQSAQETMVTGPAPCGP
ncbi:MAG: efflux RND transporter permease subunit [Pirellulaceae bacterium]|nr:efflux RND transporter permease subunit [Pirellulaceae bacterium]